MHVLIIEATLTGHHSGYVARIAAAYMNAGHSVTLTVLQRDATNPAILQLVSQFSGSFSLFLLDDARFETARQSRLGVPWRELACRHLFGQAYRSVHQAKPIDYVFLPYIDYCLYALALMGSPFGSTQWGGICMRPSFHYYRYGVIAPRPQFASIKRALFLKLLQNKTLRSIYTIDNLLFKFVSEMYPRFSRRLQYAPDPVESKGCYSQGSARRALGIADDATVILIYGVIDGRKGLDTLLAAFCSDRIPDNINLLIVGKHAPPMLELVKATRGIDSSFADRIHVIDRFVDEEVQQSVFAAADIVWLGYSGHYTMSGVLVLAVNYRKPVIATSGGLIGWYTNKYNLGLAIDVNNSTEIISAIREIVSRPLLESNEEARALFDKHSWAHFLSVLV